MSAPPSDAQAAFVALLGGLRRNGSARRPPRLEPVWKIEAQLLLPALPRSAAGLQAAREVELLRDLAQLLERLEVEDLEAGWSLIAALAELHFARVDALLQGTALDWPAVQAEAQAWVHQWSDELRAHGEIEDEDLDPVGLPPR